jgi:hypothetical protein
MSLDARAFAAGWKETCNSHDLDRIASLYSQTVIFKSPRIVTLAGEQRGTLHGRASVRACWQKLFERRPDLTFVIEQVFAGVDTVALEYRVGDLRGVEFMTLDSDGLITFAAGNDLA